MDIRYITSAGYQFWPYEIVYKWPYEIVYKYMPVCEPDMIAHEEGVLYVDADDYRPSTRADSEDETPGMRSDVEDLRPSLRAFPEP